MHGEEPSWNEFKRENRLKHRLDPAAEINCREQGGDLINCSTQP